MPTGPVFEHNGTGLTNIRRNITQVVKLGNGLIKFYQDFGADRLLAVSIVEETKVVPNRDLSFHLAHIGGIPLSVSVCYDTDLNPSAGDNVGSFYALDVIITTPVEDGRDRNTIVLNPNINGVVMGLSKSYDLFYLKAYRTSTTPSPRGLINFGGVPMAYGKDAELIIRDSNYTINDVDINRYQSLNFYGVPIRVGMVNNENKYYLIINLDNVP